MKYDAAIIGTGPAGLSAALTLKANGKSFVWIGSRDLSDKISKAERIENYPGLTSVSGKELAEAFKKQIEAAGIEIKDYMVNQIMPFDDGFALMAGSEFFEARTVILSTGIVMSNTIPGESERVGRGVSYCATCDGGLYRGKTVAVFCGNRRFEHEAKYLSDLAAKVYFFPTYPTDESIAENAETMKVRIREVIGDKRVEKLLLSDGSELPVDGLFCLRDSVALNTLMPSLETENGHIRVDRSMQTNIPGIFAAGDCTGRPYQYAKAIGEGNVAAHSVVAYLSKE